MILSLPHLRALRLGKLPFSLSVSYPLSITLERPGRRIATLSNLVRKEGKLAHWVWVKNLEFRTDESITQIRLKLNEIYLGYLYYFLLLR